MNRCTFVFLAAVLMLSIILGGQVGAAVGLSATSAQQWPLMASPGSSVEMAQPAAPGAPSGLVTTRVSVASAGAQGNAESYSPALSGDGRYVAFESLASDLAPGDANDEYDVFVHDRQTGQTKAISVDAAGNTGNGDSGWPAISSTGRYVTFYSSASNLVPGDTNEATDIFLYDRETGAMQRVSVSSSEAQANHDSYSSAVSADGRYVAFASEADTLVSGDTNGSADIFVRDVVAGETWRVSVASGGEQGNDASGSGVSISSDGRRVAFDSLASNLVPNDNNAQLDVFVRDWVEGWTRMASISSGGEQGNDESYIGDISGNGQLVAFTSLADNLVPADTNAEADAFVHDLSTHVTERVSVSSAEAQSNGGVNGVSTDEEGRLVVFDSAADDLVSGDANGFQDVFVRDRLLGQTSLVSVATDGAQGNADAFGGADIADNGSVVAFESDADNLVPGDSNEATDIFARTYSLCFTLTLQKSGSGDAPTASPGQSIGCEPGRYHRNEVIALQAAPASGWRVDAWSGTGNDVSQALTNTVTMPNGDHTVGVVYVLECYALTLIARPAGGGSVAASPLQSAGCMTNYQYTPGAVVSLAATPTAGYTFAGWSGALTGSQNPATVVMDGDRSVTADFYDVAGACHNLGLSATGEGAALVADPARSPACTANGWYTPGTLIRLTAAPAPGWHIDGWTGTNDDSSVAATNWVTMPADAHSAGVGYVRDDVPGVQPRAFAPVIMSLSPTSRRPAESQP